MVEEEKEEGTERGEQVQRGEKRGQRHWKVRHVLMRGKSKGRRDEEENEGREKEGKHVEGKGGHEE